MNASTYYTVVDSYSEAKQLGCENLISYKNGVAVYDSKVDESLEENHILKPTNLNTGYHFQESGYKEIEFESVYRNDITGKGSVVAIIDTGCDLSHPDLKDNIIGYYNSADGFDVNDEDGHGTSVAGVVAASDNSTGIIGVAPDAKLYIIKACRKKQSIFYYSDVVRAVNKAVDVGVNVINMSLAGEFDSKYLEEAVKNAREHGILVVCAAGNESTGSPEYPAAYQVGLSVGGSWGDSLVSYSNFGINANIVAPCSAYTTSKDNLYLFANGTSFSTPYVSGAAALIYGYYQGIAHDSSGADYVKNLILNNTDGKVYTSIFGSVKGRLNLQNIFKTVYISSPNKPKLVIKENSRTHQQIITVKSKGDIEVYYSIKGDTKISKLNNKLCLDKKGTYQVSFVAKKPGTRAYSNVITEKITVSKKVYSQKYLDSIELNLKKKKMKAGTVQQIKIETVGKKKIDRQRIKWISSNPKIASIDKMGTITVSNNAPKGKKVTFTAKIGNVKKTVTIKIK